MKAIFEFDLSEDYREYEVMNQANRSQSFMYEFSQQLRSWIKYSHTFKDADDALVKIRDEFYRLLDNHRVNIDL